MKIGGSEYNCSGSLMNNTSGDYTPYVLSADHCAYQSFNYATPEELETWIFYFNYESAECEGNTPGPGYFSLTGADKIAQGGNRGTDGSDFYLLRLIDNIPNVSSVYFNGWSILNEPSSSGVTIHHPDGLVKKISTYTDELITSAWLGDGVYGQMKYESGVHRVQRVPKTETQGRVHTSAASVVVLPEAEEFDVEIQANDIRKDLYCSSGPGGQSVNTTYSAVRLTHIPTGIVATCQDQKSQMKNYDKALSVLRTRIFELEYQKYLDDVSSKRKTMVSTGDRSAKIRTYNWPQGRVTDHRISLTLYNLQSIIDGNIQELIDKLQMAENAERLKEDIA